MCNWNPGYQNLWADEKVILTNGRNRNNHEWATMLCTYSISIEGRIPIRLLKVTLLHLVVSILLANSLL